MNYVSGKLGFLETRQIDIQESFAVYEDWMNKQAHVTVMYAPSGFYIALMVWNPEESDYEMENDSPEEYADERIAIISAKLYAKQKDLPYVPRK